MESLLRLNLAISTQKQKAQCHQQQTYLILDFSSYMYSQQQHHNSCALLFDGKFMFPPNRLPKVPNNLNSTLLQPHNDWDPMLYVTAKDVKVLSQVSRLLKYANGITLLVPSNSDVDLEDEFENVKQWAKDIRMILNSSKTREIVFRRSNPKTLFVYQSPLPQIEQVKVAKLLAIILSERLHFDFAHNVLGVLKVCSQRMYLLKLLRAQGLSLVQLNTVFQDLILNKIRYAIPAWSRFLSAHLTTQINSLLKLFYKYGYCLEIVT